MAAVKRTATQWTMAVAVALGLVSPTPASAHGGDNLALPVIEQAFPKVEGVTIDIAFSATYQFVATNTTDQDLAVLADSGEPFLRIGPEGVFGNFRSPASTASTSPKARSPSRRRPRPAPTRPPTGG